jgi:hypothetical protein
MFQKEYVFWSGDVTRISLFLLKIVLFDSFTNVDLREGSMYIKSACEPFDAEIKMDWKRVRNWLTETSRQDGSLRRPSSIFLLSFSLPYIK